MAGDVSDAGCTLLEEQARAVSQSVTTTLLAGSSWTTHTPTTSLLTLTLDLTLFLTLTLALAHTLTLTSGSRRKHIDICAYALAHPAIFLPSPPPAIPPRPAILRAASGP
eukprot:scaffold18284_cov40-Phaeocystis_antarctica.AAC.1